MDQRLQLQSLLETVIGSRNDGKDNVYFQPPETVKLVYPCIIYSRSTENTRFANNKPYNNKIGYTIHVIDANPDSAIPEKIALLPMCSFDRSYTKDNLNHNIYRIYY
jgi:hypothetical protein